MRRKILTAGLLLAAIPIVLVGAALLYLNLADLSRWRTTVETTVGRALGRELRIGGDFRIAAGLTTRLTATGVSLANPSWCREPVMVAAERIEISIDVLPLLRRRVHIPRIAVDGVHVWLETDAAGRSSWMFDTQAGQRPPDRAPQIEIGAVSVRDLVASYRDPRLRRRLDLELSRLAMSSGRTGALDLHLDGALNESPLALAGRVGPLEGILSGGPIEHDLRGRLGSAEITTRGAIQDLAALTGVDLVLDARGPDAAGVTEIVGGPSIGGGPFEVAVRLSPSGRATAISLSASLGPIAAVVEGRTDSLAAPRELEASVSAHGPDLAAAGSLVGLDDLPAEPFALAGRVAWDSVAVELDGCEVSVGENHLWAEGVLGAPVRSTRSDLRFEGSGSDLAAIGRLAGLDLPRGEYSIRGRIEGRGDGFTLDGVELRAGGSTITAGGTVGDPPALAGTDLAIRASGPDLSVFSGLARRTLPAAAFEVKGALRPAARGIALRRVTARVGGHRAAADGVVGTARRLVGTDLRLTVEGPDLAWIAGQLGIARAPAEAYTLDGRLVVRPDSLALDDVAGRIADVTIAASGTLGRGSSRAAADLTLRIEGADASWPGALAGISGLPAEPFVAHGRVVAHEHGYDLDGVEATIGSASFAVSGRLGQIPDLDGSNLSLKAHLPSLTRIAFFPKVTLPAVEASISGRASVERSEVRLEDAVIEVGGTRITGRGTIARTAGLIGSDVELELTSPDLAAAGRLIRASGLATLPELPAEPLTVAGRIAVNDAGFSLEGIRLALGSATGRVDGLVGRPPDLRHTDLTITGDGPDASLVSAVTGRTIPVAPFHVDGRIARVDTGLRFADLHVQLGEYRIEGSGTLGEPPRFVGTDLELDARGPSLALIQELLRTTELPDLPFELQGRFHGTPGRFTSDRLAARLGSSDVSGWFRVDLEQQRPRVDAELTSRQVDLTELLGSDRAVLEPAESPARRSQQPSAEGTIISNRPFSLAALGRLDGEIRWALDSVRFPLGRFSDVDVGARLVDGSLRVEPVRAVAGNGGTLEGTVRLDASGTSHTFAGMARLAGVPVDLTAAEDNPARWPKLDLEVDLEATGRSLHEMASSADGRIALTLGSGPADGSVLDLIAADLLVEVLRTLNPLSAEHESTLECGVVLIELERGVARLDPFAVQSDRTTVVGDGRLDLASESLDLVWVAKPRKGLGISASALTNAYLKLGGTLASPKIETKPLEALATTGAAVATGGLSLLGQGLLNRITAEKKVCTKARERAEEIAP